MTFSEKGGLRFKWVQGNLPGGKEFFQGVEGLLKAVQNNLWVTTGAKGCDRIIGVKPQEVVRCICYREGGRVWILVDRQQ